MTKMDWQVKFLAIYDFADKYYWALLTGICLLAALAVWRFW